MILKAKFRFNRPIDKTKEFIHIDGFTVTADGKQYRFDFLLKHEDGMVLIQKGYLEKL